jgi:hypothetical protein
MKPKGVLVFPIESGLFEVPRKMRNGECFACDGLRFEVSAAIETAQGSRVKTVSAWRVEGSPAALPAGTRKPWQATPESRERDRVGQGYLGWGREARLDKRGR